jgi:hypothetical protein
MQTIKSNGGPLICIERDFARFWLGTSGNSQKSDNGQVLMTDYERACDIADYIGAIKCANETALILGDMPLETMVGLSNDQVPYILRVYYMDPDTDPVSILEGSHRMNVVDPIESMNFFIERGDLMIFDSATPGSFVGDSCLSFRLLPGSYRVLTKRIEPNDRTSVLVHQFVSNANNVR